MRKYVAVLFLMAISCGVMTNAEASFWKRGHDRGNRYGYPHSSHYPYGHVRPSLSRGYVEIGFSGSKYFYNTGIFYRQGPRLDYVVVPPPQGVVVYALPDERNRVIVDRVTYYTYNGVYYTRVPEGYEVVQPPAQVIVEPTMVAVSPVAQKMQDEFTINIPNTTGSGYASVMIKRSGTGFTGPQGEYYAEFPKIVQLQAMYGK